MKKYYEKVNLPTLPDKFITDIDTMTANGNICPTGNIKPSGDSIFAVYEVNQEIYDIYQPLFDKEISIRWQIITSDLPIHYDWGTGSDKYLYLIDRGGDDVVTKFYTDYEKDDRSGGSFEQGERELTFEVKEIEKSWFRLNVKQPHQVVNITRPRIALILRPRK